MPSDPVLGGLLNPADEVLVTDYLGAQSPVSTRGQASIPTGGAPVAPSAAPVAPGGTGIGAAPAGATPGGPSARSSGSSSALRNAQLATQAADRLGKLLPGQPPTEGGGVNPDPNAPEAQQGGQSGTPPVPVPPPTSMDLFKDFPEEIITPATETPSGFDMATLGDFGPYAQAALAAAELVPNVVGRAGSKMPAGEQAALAANEAIGVIAAPFTAGLSAAVTPAFDQIISDWFGKPHKSRAESAALGNRDLMQSYNVLQGALAGAQTPEEIADAFATIEGQTYRGNKLPYPVAQGFDVQDRAALLKALGGDDPSALSFAWQGFGTEEAATSANTALNNAVRQQMGLIRAAQAGDPQARELLTALGEARKATLAQGEAGMETRQAAAEADVGGSYARQQQMM